MNSVTTVILAHTKYYFQLLDSLYFVKSTSDCQKFLYVDIV